MTPVTHTMPASWFSLVAQCDGRGSFGCCASAFLSDVGPLVSLLLRGGLLVSRVVTETALPPRAGLLSQANGARGRRAVRRCWWSFRRRPVDPPLSVAHPPLDMCDLCDALWTDSHDAASIALCIVA
ncbi:hypothetical protein GCM10020219_070250 [Nonomuraea dietziae]